jgi:outer membrane protein assembly factor BamA
LFPSGSEKYMEETIFSCRTISSAVPTLQLDKDRGTVVLTISIDEGPQFTFGRLILAGQGTRAGEADTLRGAWRPSQGDDTTRHSCVGG